MLELTTPSKGLIFFSFLYRADLFNENDFSQRTESLFGNLIHFKPSFNPLSAFYAKEMGNEDQLFRVFFVTTSTFPREFLLTTKLLGLEWEREWSMGLNRMVNVDIGFLSAENFILATTKNYAHRVFLGQNIFADLTYQCVSGDFECLPWTYPDFKDKEKIDFFHWCRSFLLMQSKVQRT
jgi:hypothetical protein